MVPTNREEFKAYCLRKLGAPVIKINLSRDQIDDRVDEALSFFYDYAMDGTEVAYYKYQVTAEDQANKYITLPENIIGAVRIFDVSAINSSIQNPFNIQYQIALNDLYTLATASMTPYYVAMTQLELIQEMLVGQKPIRFNRHSHRLYVDANWENFLPGTYLIVEAYSVMDPETYSSTWSNRFLQNYCAALIKRDWAQVLSKYKGLKMPGDVEFNAEGLAAEADAEITKYEDLISQGNIPQAIFTG